MRRHFKGQVNAGQWSVWMPLVRKHTLQQFTSYTYNSSLQNYIIVSFHFETKQYVILHATKYDMSLS